MTTKIIVTCLDWRVKYKGTVGNIDYFDHVIDITNLVHPRLNDIKLNHRIFPDSITDKCTVPSSFEQFKVTIENLKPTCCIVLRPLLEYPSMDQYLREINKNCQTWSICLNKQPLTNISLFAMFKYLVKTFSGYLLQPKNSLKPDILYTNNVERNLHVVLKYRPNKIVKVRHMDHPTGSPTPHKRNVGLFLDGFIPFHSEFNYLYEQVSPKQFYSQLEEYLRLQKDKYKLESILISAHPNSDGAEKKYLRDHEITYASTAEIIVNYRRVWSFGSEATSLAVLLDIPCQNVIFPNILPEGFVNTIIFTSYGRGIPLSAYDGRAEKDIVSDSYSMKLKRKILKYYMNPHGITLVDDLLRREYIDSKVSPGGGSK